LSAQARARATRALELRRAFDASFAAAPAPQGASPESLLVVRIGEGTYGVRLAEIRGLMLDRRVTGVPTASPALLGVAGVQAAVVPVYSLPVLFGCPPVPALRWMLLAGQREPIGFAFERFEAQLRARADELAAPAEDQGGRTWLRGVVRSGEKVIPLIDIPRLVDSIASQGPTTRLRGAGTD
jgi:chemotaxis signal transduction protein